MSTEEKNLNEVQAAEQTTSQENISELDVIKAELKSVTEERDKFSRYWIDAIADIKRYQQTVNKLIEELGWDNATAMGKVGEILGDSLWRVIELNNTSRFNI